MIEETKPQGYPLRLIMRLLAAKWRRERDSNPCGVAPKRFSRPPRYDHFDIPPYMNCRQADFIGYSIFLEIFLEMRFLVAFGVPEKSVFTRIFCVFATAVLANFQDRLVMTASIPLRMDIQLWTGEKSVHAAESEKMKLPCPMKTSAQHARCRNGCRQGKGAVPWLK